MSIYGNYYEFGESAYVLVEGPTWAPNGRVLMFFREKRRRGVSDGTAQLFSIDLTGYNERLILTPAGASDPAWSPLVR